MSPPASSSANARRRATSFCVMSSSSASSPSRSLGRHLLDQVRRVVGREEPHPRPPLRRRQRQDERRLVGRRELEEEVLGVRVVEERRTSRAAPPRSGGASRHGGPLRAGACRAPGRRSLPPCRGSRSRGGPPRLAPGTRRPDRRAVGPKDDGERPVGFDPTTTTLASPLREETRGASSARRVRSGRERRRAPARELPPRGGARPRRHGHGLPRRVDRRGTRRPGGFGGGPQGVPSEPVRPGGRVPAVPAGSRDRDADPERARRADVRARGGRGRRCPRPLPRHGFHRGPEPRGAPEGAGHRPGAPARPDRRPGPRCAPGRPRAGRRPSRREAREHRHHARLPRAPDGPRRGPSAGGRQHAHEGRGIRRVADLRGPRAVHARRRADGAARRPLCLRRRPPRARDGDEPVRPPHLRGDDPAEAAGGHAAAAVPERGDRRVLERIHRHRDAHEGFGTLRLRRGDAHHPPRGRGERLVARTSRADRSLRRRRGPQAAPSRTGGAAHRPRRRARDAVSDVGEGPDGRRRAPDRRRERRRKVARPLRLPGAVHRGRGADRGRSSLRGCGRPELPALRRCAPGPVGPARRRSRRATHGLGEPARPAPRRHAGCRRPVRRLPARRHRSRAPTRPSRRTRSSPRRPACSSAWPRNGR